MSASGESDRLSMGREAKILLMHSELAEKRRKLQEINRTRQGMGRGPGMGSGILPGKGHIVGRAGAVSREAPYALQLTHSVASMN